VVVAVLAAADLQQALLAAAVLSLSNT